MSEPVSARRWAVRGLLLLLLAFANVNDIWSPDVVPNTLFAWTLLREGDADYDELTFDPGKTAVAPEGKIARDSYFFRPCRPAGPADRGVPRPPMAGERPTSPRSPGGPPPPGPDEHVCSIFPPGISLLALPVLAPFVIAGADPADGGMLIRAGHLAAALMEVVAALLLWSVARRFTGPRAALVLVLLYWLATSVRTVSSQALWQHAGVHLALALGLWLVLAERVSARRELLAGAVMGLGVGVRQTTAILALGLARLPWPPLAAVRPSAPLLYAIGAAIGVLPLLLYNALALGSPFEQGYGDKPFHLETIWAGLYGLLLSPSRGLFVYEPWIVAALAALALAFRRHGLVALRLRGIAVAWVLLVVSYASYLEWWGGRVFGPRFLDDLAPALVAALAWGISQGLLAPRVARAAFALAAAWSLLLFNAAAFVYDPGTWDTVPTNVNFDPSRLYDWSDPQWLHVLFSFAQPDARVLSAVALTALTLALLVRLELRGSRAA